MRVTTPESGTNRARGAGAETFFTKPLDFGVLHGETEARVERAGAAQTAGATRKNGRRSAMSVRLLYVMLMGAAVIFSTIAHVPSFAASEETKWINVQDLYKQCDARQGSFDEIFCLEFVSGVARQLFTNRLALKDIKTSRDLIMMSIPSACPTSFVSNGAMVQAFSEWAKRHPEEWSATAQIGVMRAVRDTWPCP